MHLAGGVADNEGRTRIGLGLGNRLDGLVHICAHRDLRHIDVAIAHGDLRQALLGNGLTGSGKLCHLTDIGRLGGLTAGVGIHLGIEDHHIHILALCQHMIQADFLDRYSL